MQYYSFHTIMREDKPPIFEAKRGGVNEQSENVSGID